MRKQKYSFKLIYSMKFWILVMGLLLGQNLFAQVVIKAAPQTRYPSNWFAPINDPNKPSWEILPQERHAGEVILSKRQ